MEYVGDSLFGNHLFLYLYFALKTALFPHFSHRVFGVLPRLVWGQRSCSASFIMLLDHLRAFGKWESISLSLSGSVGIQDHAVAGIQGHAVAETPTGMGGDGRMRG